MEYSIIPVEEKHIAQIAEIEKLCFSMPHDESQLIFELNSDVYILFAAVCGDAVLGYAGVSCVIDEGSITNVAVHPARRRLGIADALMHRMDELASEKELAFITLEVRESNAPAIALYEKNGYVHEGILRNYYTLPKENGIIMTRHYK